MIISISIQIKLLKHTCALLEGNIFLSHFILTYISALLPADRVDITFVTLVVILTKLWLFKFVENDDDVIKSHTFQIEKCEYDFWKAREKVDRESVLRFPVRPIVSEIISLDVLLRPNYCFPTGYFLISLNILLRPNYCFPTGYFLILLNIIIIPRPFFVHLFLIQVWRDRLEIWPKWSLGSEVGCYIFSKRSNK